jgi:hypothetical protein
MSDGLAGAQLLSWQLATDRLLDSFVEAQAANAAEAAIGRAWAANDAVIRQFNVLVGKYNLLLKAARVYEAECNRCFTQFEERIAQLEQENAELRAAKEKAEAEVIECAKANVRRIFAEPWSS